MATVQGATQVVAGGAVAAVVVGTFVAPYEVGIMPAWATDKLILAADKLATQFTVSFNVPAPPVGSSFDWGVLGS